MKIRDLSHPFICGAKARRKMLNWQICKVWARSTDCLLYHYYTVIKITVFIKSLKETKLIWNSNLSSTTSRNLGVNVAWRDKQNALQLQYCHTGSTGLTASSGDTVRSSKQHVFLENDVRTDMGTKVFILWTNVAILFIVPICKAALLKNPTVLS